MGNLGRCQFVVRPPEVVDGQRDPAQVVGWRFVKSVSPQITPVTFVEGAKRVIWTAPTLSEIDLLFCCLILWHLVTCRIALRKVHERSNGSSGREMFLGKSKSRL